MLLRHQKFLPSKQSLYLKSSKNNNNFKTLKVTKTVL